MIAGFLHDLFWDTDCRIEEIKKEFNERVATLVSACIFDRNVNDYKERWRKLISNIKQVGRDVLIIKFVGQMENLPYYMLILDQEKKQEVMWGHKFFIEECKDDLKDLLMFKGYEKMVKDYELTK